MKIAICDDDKQLRKDLRHLIEVQLDLMAFTYEIEEYESGNALLEHIDKKNRTFSFWTSKCREWEEWIQPKLSESWRKRC